MGDVDIPGYIRRVRRMADLSQRELAEVLGVSASCVARFESGHRAVSAELFVRILAVAGLRTVVVDDEGTEFYPAAVNAVRDNASRHFPAHLDVDPPDQVPPLRRMFPRYDRPPARGWYHLRRERDRLRAVRGCTPADHPTEVELARRRASAAVRLAHSSSGSLRTASRHVECRCEVECWVGTTCTDDCICRCEPDGRTWSG